MSTKTVTLAAAALALVATTGFASAHSTKGVDRTQDGQFQAITEARLKGELTKREYNQLLDEQNRISEMERAAKADGRVTGREIKAIKEAQSEARGHISSEAHDGQKSWFRRWLYNHR